MICGSCNGSGQCGPDLGKCPNCNGTGEEEDDIYEVVMHYRNAHPEPKQYHVKFIFAWYDLGVGFFWDNKKKWLYFFPIPMCGLIFKFRL